MFLSRCYSLGRQIEALCASVYMHRLAQGPASYHMGFGFVHYFQIKLVLSGTSVQTNRLNYDCNKNIFHSYLILIYKKIASICLDIRDYYGGLV